MEPEGGTSPGVLVAVGASGESSDEVSLGEGRVGVGVGVRVSRLGAGEVEVVDAGAFGVEVLVGGLGDDEVLALGAAVEEVVVTVEEVLSVTAAISLSRKCCRPHLIRVLGV